MMRALYTAATGMIAEQQNLDTISNNLSNVNTTGYKTERTEFKSLLYQTLQTRTTTANGAQKPVGAQVGLGTRVAATMSMYTQHVRRLESRQILHWMERDSLQCAVLMVRPTIPETVILHGVWMQMEILFLRIRKAVRY